MKTILIFALAVAASSSLAQSNNAYWVTERNPNRPGITTVSFYSSENVLLQQSVIQGRSIDITKRKHKRLLDQLLSNYLKGDNSFSHKLKQKRPV